MFDFYLDCLIKILLAFAAGFILGLERKSRQRDVGMRTLILICISASMLSILSDYISKEIGTADNARLAAGVVSGIGFLGAGVIMKTGFNIKGLTSAAIIWADATIGLCIGEGLFIPSFILVFICVVSLLALEKVESLWFPAGSTKFLHLTFKTETLDMLRLGEVIQKYGFYIKDVNLSKSDELMQTVVEYRVMAPRINDYTDFIQSLNTVAKLSEFSIGELNKAI